MALVLPSRFGRPWAVPAVAAVAVAAVAVVPHALAGSQHPRLPARTATQIVAAVNGTSVHAFSAKVASTPHLGLPQLPGSDGGNQLSTLFTEPSSWTIAVDGTKRQRVSLLGTGKEMDVVRNGSSIWTWDSSAQSATHYQLVTGASSQQSSSSPATPEASPMALARKIVSAVTPSTRLNVGPTAEVAGRSAYTLVVIPRTSGSLIGKAVIAVDSATGLPLGVSLYPTGSAEAAISEQVTSLSLSTPSASTFNFTPPADASVTRHAVTGHAGTAEERAAKTQRRVAADRGVGRTTQPHVIGENWTAVGVYPAGAGGVTSGLDSALSGATPGGSAGHGSAGILQAATNPGPNGSRLLQTRLFTVMLTRSGTVLAGAVPASRLESVARSGA